MNSMTGFGRGESRGSRYEITVEIKSVNHRFRDLRFRMHSLFHSLEGELTKAIEQRFKRGSFDIRVAYQKVSGLPAFTDELDTEKIEHYLSLLKPLCQKQKVPLQVHPSDFLRPEFALEKNQERENELYPLAHKALESAMNQLQGFRQREGLALVNIMQQHLRQYQLLLSGIESQTELFEQGVRERILSKFQQYKQEFASHEGRFQQEIIYYLERVDIAEETNRIHTHLQVLNDLLSPRKETRDEGGEIGRQLDFLVQELNRETNTIGSKSSVAKISQAVVQMKVQLEKLREQALNLE